MHFLMLVATGVLFTAGVALYPWDFFFFLGLRMRAEADQPAQAATTPA